MDSLGWLLGFFSNRGKALSLYRRGMVKARRDEHQGAIDDYTASLEVRGIPTDVQGMALYNRALMYLALGKHDQGTQDLEAVLALKGSLHSIKTMARQKLFRMDARLQREESEKTT